MKRSLLILLSFVFLPFILLAEPLVVKHKVSDVCIYHSGARINRESDMMLKKGTHILYFKNISSKIVLNSFIIKNEEISILNRKLNHKMSDEQLLRIKDELLAQQNSLTLLENKFNNPEFITKQEELPLMIEYYTTKTTEIKKRIRELQKSISEAETMSQFNLINDDVCILELSVNVSQDMNKPLSMSYVTGGIGWSPFYEISIESSSANTMHVRYMARLMSQTGENWKNIKVKVSSAFPLDVPTTLPEPQNPWIVEDGSSYNNIANIQRFNFQREQNELQIERLSGVRYQEINAPGFLESIDINGYHNIESNSIVIALPIKELDIPANFYYYCYPSVETQAYLVADIFDWGNEQFVDGLAGIVYEGNDLGSTMLRFSEENDTLMLPVGKDNKIFIDYIEIADEKELKDVTFSRKKRLTQSFRLIVKNNQDHTIHMLMKEQIPISQSDETDVELLNISGGKTDNEKGEVFWLMDLNSGETAEKRLSFEISSETERNFKKRSHHYSKRTISCPSF